MESTKIWAGSIQQLSCAVSRAELPLWVNHPCELVLIPTSDHDALLSRVTALEAELAAAKDDYATMLNANMDNVERLTALRAENEALKKQVAEAEK